MIEALQYREQTDWEAVATHIRYVLKEYVAEARLQSLVIGESGGIDSALTTILARPVCNELGIRLIGRSITIESNRPDELSRAEAIGQLFCHDFRTIDLTPLYLSTRQVMEEEPMNEETTSKTYKLRMGNIKARLRMIYLYNLAQRHKGMVLSTDNYTEWMLGFWTLHGDVGDFNPMFGLWKTEVYKLAKHILSTLESEQERQALSACICCTPTDGLGITSSDVEQLGAKNYSEVDQALITYLTDGTDRVNPLIISRHRASQFKRLNPRFISRRETFSGK